MTARVLIAPEAEAQIRAIDAWWRAKRPAAAGLFAEELAAAMTSISAAPELGRRYAHQEVRGVRRMLLRASRYHLYYVHDSETVFVLAVWGAVRGVGPPLASVPRRS